MPQINTFLTFKDQAEEAVRFYTSIFPNSKISRVTRYPDLGPQSPAKPGSVMTVDFTLDGRAFTALNGGPQFTFTEAISFQVSCESQEEVDRLWSKLIGDGGKESACGWLKDKFGLSWQITPKRLLELIGDKDSAKASRAMNAMMEMVKIDIAKIEAAAKG